MSITIWTSYNNIAFKINPGPDFKDDRERLKLISGKIPIYDFDKFKHWEIPKSSLNKLFIVYQNKVLIQDDAKEYINFYKLQTANVSSLPKTAILVKPFNQEKFFKLDPYQEDYIGIYEKRLGILGLLDMSAGKTLCSLLMAANRTYTKLLIVVPAQIITEWQAAVEDILGLEALTYTGSIPKKKRQMLDLASANIIICNPEMIKEINEEKLKIDSVIVDEVHIIGTGQAYKELKKLTRKVFKVGGTVQGLTATPIENDIEDLWYLVNLLNPELAGDKQEFLSKYREPTYFINVPNPRAEGEFYKKAVKFKPKNMEELKEFIAAASFRVSSKLFIKTNNNKQIIPVDMTKRQKEVYEEIRESLILLSKDKTFYLNNPLTRLNKVLQAAEGIYNIYPNEVESGKMDYIVHELNECVVSGRKAVVRFMFKEGSNILHSYYPNTAVLINGDQSSDLKFLAKLAFQGSDNKKHIERFNELRGKHKYPFGLKEAQFLFSTYSTRSGMGENLGLCDIQYFMSYSFSSSAFKQTTGRIVRRNSLFDDVYTKMLVSKDTVESFYVRQLLTKLENLANLMDGQQSAADVLSARDIVRMLG